MSTKSHSKHSVSQETLEESLEGKHTSIPLFHLAWPIMIEHLLRVAISSADVFMLKYYNENAVAAAGLTVQFAFFVQLLFLMITSGASILISQSLGAREHARAAQFAVGSISLGTVSALLLGLLLTLMSPVVVGFFNLEPQVHTYALQYMVVFSSGSVFIATSMIFANILRSYGYSKAPMFTNVFAMLLNIFGNYLFLFGVWGMPVLGVKGVALSTVFSHLVATIVLLTLIKAHKNLNLPWRKMLSTPFSVYKQILAIGVPTAGENISYNLGQIAIMRMLSHIGTEAMAASVYAMTVLRYVFITSISIGIATQIKVGYYVGAKMFEQAKQKVYGYFLTGFSLSAVLVSVLFMFRSPVMNMLTDNPDILHLLSSVFIVALFMEPGRNFNVIIVPALKGAGDVKFPVCAGIVFMWGIGVFLAYMLGIALGWGLLGVWIALAMDEWIRGGVMILRWRSGKWHSKNVRVKQSNTFPE
ncbi:MATE family efflux transporter [Chitinispirillales bacterium ANBcel5]|uniref:MATE family efflux transporter n=1 Tax=Cellulosispirillum alkaliphilum TaxID=3039283 RepID=UPI002A576940|nr:MATE family efflux transporter [Chitinispirillales bacterium ANBcel5]